jgi:hypothetical protein
MMLNNMINEQPANDAAFKNTMLEYTNLRKYVNDSLMLVSKMKSCSVPQFGDMWEWKQFNKWGVAPKVVAPVAAQTQTQAQS